MHKIDEKSTKYDNIIRYLKDHVFFSILIFLGIALISISTVLNSAKSVFSIFPNEANELTFDNTAWNVCIDCYEDKSKTSREFGILFYDNGYFSKVDPGIVQDSIERDGRYYRCSLSVFDVYKIEVSHSDSDSIGKGCVYLKYKKDHCYIGLLGSGDGPNYFAGVWEKKNNKLTLSAHENENEFLETIEIDLDGNSSTEIEAKAYSKLGGYEHVYMTKVPRVSSSALPTSCIIDKITESILNKN